jgi:hypothetical protein
MNIAAADINCYPYTPNHFDAVDNMTKVYDLQIYGGTKSEDIIKVFGDSKVKETGDAGNYKISICYISEIDDTGIEFQGGEGGINTMIIDSDYKTINNYSLCGKSNKVNKNIKLGRHIKLNMSPFEIMRLGLSRQIERNKYEIRLETKVIDKTLSGVSRISNVGSGVGYLVTQTIDFYMSSSDIDEARVTRIVVTRDDNGIYIDDCIIN